MINVFITLSLEPNLAWKAEFDQTLVMNPTKEKLDMSNVSMFILSKL